MFILNDNHIFALDIGTRSVVGLILKEINGKFQIVDMIAKEHDERSMLDGQIHDVISVSKIISDIKCTLEKKHGTLNSVCVAAAGRALKTKRSKITVNVSGKPIFNKQDILHLELSAVQKAQISLASENQAAKSNHYYCVGYSVLHYLLDGEEIGNLVDQQGDEATVEVIATFLPKVVVESLLAALERADLEMKALTLEPIAAINVLIPPSMRRLNVALVDIGAGTSDIAITDLGTVVAYGMVPIAGDEITEAISDQYLLDFPLAEQVKRNLNENDVINITDILGFETKVPKEEVIEKISDSIKKLASAISDEILNLNNQKPPKAVMLVGGGSLTPSLPKLITENLQLPENRVAIRGVDAIQKLEQTEDLANHPELVTPIGIAIASSLSPVHYITVNVNENPIRMFDMKKLTVGDCLLTAGIEMNKLYGKPGMAMIVSINGRDITIPGEHGSPPTLLKNDEPTTLDSPIKNGDHIFVERGLDGKAPKVQIKELIEAQQEKTIWINEEAYHLKMEVYKNGKKVATNTLLEDNDKIETHYPKTIKELFKQLNYDEGLLNLEPFYIYFNKNKITFPGYGKELLKNGKEVDENTVIENGDHITIRSGKKPTVQDLLQKKNLSFYYQIPITFNGKQITLKKVVLDLFRNGKLLDENTTLHHGDEIQSMNKKPEPFIFQDIFRYVEIELPNAQSGNFVLLKNGEETTFYEQLSPGDELKIVWPQTK